MPSLPLSILDLAPVAEGSSTSAALDAVRDLARLGDAAGFTRLWYAEHHGMPAIASSSPEVLIATAAAATSRIRVGSGGVMLPNHVPLRVAETYRTLEALHPGRIDLGIGRAGGTDPRTLQALRSFGGEHFSEQLAELLAYENQSFPAGHPFATVMVVPDAVPLPPIWLLGSSGASAEFAGMRGSPTPPGPAFEAYRNAFRPSRQFPEPHAILAVSALVAPTREEAEFLSGSQALSWALLHAGQPRKLVSPEAAAAHDWTPAERQVVASHKPLWLIGTPAEVRDRILAMAADSGADEVMITTTMWSYELRLRSFRLLAEAFALA